MSVLPVGFGSALGGYQIERSLRFNSADSAYLNRTPASAGNRRTFTWSGWVKRGALSSSASYFLFAAGSFAGSTNTSIRILNDSINIYWGGTGGPQWTATAVLRDPSAWYHLVFAFDTTQATFGNRLKLYVNGVQSTVWSLQETGGLTAQNSDLYINNNQQHNLGASGTPGNYFDGYLTEVNFIDGQALTPSSFGETDSATGVWKPKAYSGTYGTNGFYLKFADNSGTTSTTLGKDSSGNGNNWTPNNFSVTAGSGNDSLVDSPTSYGTDTGVGGEVRGNYCTWNPLKNSTTLSDGNLRSFNSSTTQWLGVVGTFGMTSGKWYWECTPTVAATVIIGLANSSYSTGGHPGSDANSWGYYSANGNKYFNNSGTSYGATYTANDVIGVAFDADAGTLTFYKNGVSQGTAYSSLTSGPYFPAVGVLNSQILFINAGQRPFAYTAPSGFKALCTTNLPTPTIGATSTTQANKYFDIVLYQAATTNGTFTRGNLSFRPDFTWIKNRDNVERHFLIDVVRGNTNITDKFLVSNSTAAEGANAVGGTTFSVTDTGYEFVETTINSDELFFNNRTYVGWNWKANGAGSSNTSGTITSTVSANTTSGFSIATYTGNGSGGATVGHGLGVSPAMVFTKSRSNSTNWMVWHQNLTANYAFEGLNTTGAEVNGGSPSKYVRSVSSTLVTIGNDISVNQSASYTYVMYCFAPVAGYSAFGSYTGNGSTDGPFVYTGFRPAYVLIKRSSAIEAWCVMDSKREGYNVDNDPLFANLTNAEGTQDFLDLLSNGFKLRSTDTGVNGSGTYIYAAFAETPFKYSLAR